MVCMQFQFECKHQFYIGTPECNLDKFNSLQNMSNSDSVDQTYYWLAVMGAYNSNTFQSLVANHVMFGTHVHA